MSSNDTQQLADGKLLLDYPTETVARLTISNATKRNALDHSILDAIAEQVPTLDARCLILTGSDGMFSSGYDIGDLKEETFAEQAEKLVAHPFTQALETIERFPFPTLAALTGHTIGGGLELALSCDFRVAGEQVKLGMPPAKLGLVYSHTGLRKFIDTIGVTHTRELFMIGNNVDAATALHWGLVTRVVSAEQVPASSVELASEIASRAPLSQRGNKRVIRELLAAEGSLDPAVEQELVALREACFRSEDFREGVRAFGEKRQPNWQGK